MTSFHERWMTCAIEEARRAGAADEVPVGAVVVRADRVIGAGGNETRRTNDPSAHAEIVALRRAAAAEGNYRLVGASLYVTVEPCMMCAGALVHARIETLVFGAVEPRAGSVISVRRLLDESPLNHRVAVQGGVLEAECRALMQTFFRTKRRSATEPR